MERGRSPPAHGRPGRQRRAPRSATRVIENNGSLLDLEAEVQAAWTELRARSVDAAVSWSLTVTADDRTVVDLLTELNQFGPRVLVPRAAGTAWRHHLRQRAMARTPS